MSDEYLNETTSTPVSAGVRDLVVTDRWNTPAGRPNGGWVLASMLRAVTSEVRVGDPLVASINYLAAPEPGTTSRISVCELKAGRRVQTAEATLERAGVRQAHLVASFSSAREGRSDEYGSPPDLPSPDACIDPLATGWAPEGLFGRIDYRLASAPGWATGQPNGSTETTLWQRLRGGQQIDHPALALLCDSFAPAVMELGGDGSVTVQLTAHLHRLPAPGWIATRLTTRHLVGGFHEEDCELWDESGHLVAQSRQLALLL